MRMIRPAVLGCGFLVGILLSPRSSPAQYTANFQTNLISGVTSNWAGHYVVGSDTFANVLLIQNGGVLSSWSGYLGYQAASTNNTALITGVGSVWSNSYTYVGRGSSGNSLIVSNGGALVTQGHTSVGGLIGLGPGSSNNLVVVTDSGSLWSGLGAEDGLVVGAGGNANRLVIKNGGRVFTRGADIGGGGGWPASSSNMALVTDSGSVWSNDYFSVVGGISAPNSLTISNGAQLITWLVFVNGNASARVVNGGVWQSLLLHIGSLVSSGSVTIDGGTVLATDVLIGRGSDTCEDRLELVSGTVIVTNTISTGVLEVRRGKLILHGGTLRVDRFVMTNACAQLVRTGGDLIYGEAVLDPARDDDGDGMSNSWEQTHDLDPLDAVDAGVDTDGDGFTNLQESLIGTDPQDSASAFRILSVTPFDECWMPPCGAVFLVTWRTAPGKTNALQRATGNGYLADNFVDIFILTNTTGAVVDYIDAGPPEESPARFYRIRLVP